MSFRYEIVVAGDVGPMVRAALAGFEVQPAPEGAVRFLGTVKDQADLQGALHRLHDLHAELLVVRRLEE